MKKSLLTILSFAAFCSFSQTQTVDITPDKDNSMYSESGNSSGQGKLYAGHTCQANNRRALIHFDIAGNLPAGATVTAVSLDLNADNAGSSAGAQDFTLHPVNIDWGEGTSNGGGQGAAAVAPDATWADAMVGTVNWTTPGGDFGAASASTTLAAALGVYTWSSATMVTDVQNWFNTPANNFGWILIGDEASTCTARRFGSSEQGVAPVLHVTYSCTGTVTASCQNQTVYVDAAGNATLNAADLDNGSSSTCGGSITFSASQTSFDCSDVSSGGSSSSLVITGAYDGPLPFGLPKGVELYAINDIPDLSVYGISSANNGTGTTGTPEFTFPADVITAGTYIYVASEAVEFNNFFGFAPDYTSGAVNINGDDAIELFENTSIIDVFGDVDTDGTGQAWDHVDGWAYRNASTGPDGNTFVISNWTFSGTNQLEGGTTNGTCTSPFPVGSYTAPLPSGVTVTLTATDDFGQTGTCDATVTVLDTILPTVACISTGTFMLDGTGNLTLTTGDIDDGSTDNCGIQSLSLSQTAFDCSNLGTNQITLYVTDNSGNVDSCTTTIDIQDAGGLDITVDNVTDVSCFGATDGAIDVSVSGGTAPYTYDWDNDGTGDFDDLEDLTGLPAGDYVLNVNDDVGCTTQEIVTVGSPAEIVPSFDITHVSCPGLTDGAIDMTVTGGVAPLLFDWDNDGTGDNDDTEDLSGLDDGTYNITITDDNGCSSTNLAVVADGILPVLTVTVSGATLTSDELSGPYQWLECPAFSVITGETDSAYTATSNGDYAVIVTSSTGCLDTSSCTTVSEVGFGESLNDEVLIYPNPAKNTLKISFQNEGQGDFKMMDYSGRLVLQGVILEQETIIDVSNLEVGNYIIYVTINERFMTKKLIIE